jgi:regulator of RNase E activity RraA
MVTVLRAQGISEGRAERNWPNYWAIDILVEGDIYVADGFGKVINGTLIGDVLANAIQTNSKRGVVFYGGIRDEEGIAAVPGFNAWVQGVDPSAIGGMMLTSLNAPIRIGRATVLPGDLVVAKKYGVLFIPAHLAEEVIFAAEMIELVDAFRWARLREGKYVLAEIYTNRWTDAIKADYRGWLKQHRNLPVPLADIEKYLSTQNEY